MPKKEVLDKNNIKTTACIPKWIWIAVGVIVASVIVYASISLSGLGSEKNFLGNFGDGESEDDRLGGDDDLTDLQENGSAPNETSSGGSSGGGGTGGGGTGGGTEGDSLEEITFPYTFILQNDYTSEFMYDSEIYEISMVGGESGPMAKFTLTRGGDLVEPEDHEFGEDSAGILKHGYVNFYDVDGDEEIDFQFKGFWVDPLTGETDYDFVVGELNSIIHGGDLEICQDEIDNDGDGLSGCQDPECNLALMPMGFQCNYPEEYMCTDGWDNDVDGYSDYDEIDCVSASCGEGSIIWSYLPGEDQTEPPARKGCCGENQCINIDDECVDYDIYYETGGGNSYYICGDRNYWDRCGDVEDSNSNKEEGELSDGEGFVCQSGPYRWVAI